MGELVRFQRDPERVAYEAEVRRLCALARCDDLVPEYLAGSTAIDIVAEQCLWIALRLPPPSMMARQWARVHGLAGTRRRALPRIHRSHYAPPRR